MSLNRLIHGDMTIERNIQYPVKVAVSYQEAADDRVGSHTKLPLNVETKARWRMGYVKSANICDNCETVRTVDPINAVDLASWEGIGSSTNVTSA